MGTLHRKVQWYKSGLPLTICVGRSQVNSPRDRRSHGHNALASHFDSE